MFFLILLCTPLQRIQHVQLFVHLTKRLCLFLVQTICCLQAKHIISSSCNTWSHFFLCRSLKLCSVINTFPKLFLVVCMWKKTFCEISSLIHVMGPGNKFHLAINIILPLYLQVAGGLVTSVAHWVWLETNTEFICSMLSISARIGATHQKIEQRFLTGIRNGPKVEFPF